MLPDRSKRYAGLDGDIQRLGLVQPWQLAFIAVIMITLLAVVFPRDTLIQRLYRHDDLDPLTLSYIRNLRRADPGNTDLELLDLRSRLATTPLAEIRQRVAHAADSGSPRQQVEARRVLARAELLALPERMAIWNGSKADFDVIAARYLAIDGTPDASSLRPAWINFLQRAAAQGIERTRLDAPVDRLLAAAAAAMTANTPVPVAERLALAGLAFQFGHASLADDLLQAATGNAAGARADALTRLARQALGEGRHVDAAHLYLAARVASPTGDLARQSFQEGIAALMAAGHFREAMTAADQYLGDLAGDASTRRFLARAALAAGDPARAARHARALVFDAGTP